MKKLIDLKIKLLLEDQLGMEVDTITDESEILNNGQIDSLSQMEFLMQLEKEFSIPIKDDEFSKICTYACMKKLVYEKLKI